eukprot:c32813_g1_i1 orf=213-404(+)
MGSRSIIKGLKTAKETSDSYAISDDSQQAFCPPRYCESRAYSTSYGDLRHYSRLSILSRGLER